MKQEEVQLEETKLSNPEMVWKAIEELGYCAEVSEILEFVHAQHGQRQPAKQPAPQPAQQPAQKQPATPSPVRDKQEKTPEASQPVQQKPASQKKPRPRPDASE